jgi:chromosome segregation ATPase
MLAISRIVASSRLSPIKADVDSRTSQLTDAVEQIDEALSDVEMDLDSSADELKEAMAEVERLQREVSAKEQSLQRLQQDLDRAFQAWSDHIVDLPEDSEYFDPVFTSNYGSDRYGE